MATSEPKFTAADRKQLALAAFLFYVEREYQVELTHYSTCDFISLIVYNNKTQVLEQCPLLDWPFISREDHYLGTFEWVCIWQIHL